MRSELERTARHAGSIALNRPDFSIEEKAGHANFVTTIDKQIQDYLEAELTALMPDSTVIAEEKENSELTDNPTWVVDPIDGTNNLIHDYHQSAISIALLKDKLPVIGLIYQPYTNEMFYAEKGLGSTLNGKPIHVSTNDYKHALVALGTSPYNPELAAKSLSLALTFLTECSDIRRSGSAAIDLASVACGRIDFYFEMTLKPWDFAAGALLVTEAGGVFEMPFDSDGLDFSKPHGIFASNALCRNEAILKLTK